MIKSVWNASALKQRCFSVSNLAPVEMTDGDFDKIRGRLKKHLARKRKK